MKKLLSILSATTITAILLGGHAYAEKDTEKQKVIIVFKNNEVKNKNIVVQSNGEVTKEFKNIPAMSAELTQSAINNLKHDPNVASVEYNKKVELIDTESSTAAKNISLTKQTEDWGLDAVNAKSAWSKGFTGKGVKIAILDTGVEYYHDDLKINGGASFVKDYKKDGTVDKSYDDNHGHGTHVAGIIGAKNNNIGTVGVAPDSSLYAVKIINGAGQGTVEGAIAGMDWSITNKMDIVNLSIGSPEGSPAYRAIFQKAKSKGITVVGAAGNDNLIDNSGVDYPAKYPEVIGVAALDKYNKHADFSSVGPEVDVAAPGVGVLSTYLNNKYQYMSGTSMATPYTTGILALYKNAYPKETADNIIKLMYEGTIDVESTGKDNLTGRGLIQAPMANTLTPVEYNKKITTFEPYYLYNLPNEQAKTSNKVNEQILQAISKEGDYVLIKTWLGDKYIKPKLYLDGEKIKTTKKIKLTKQTMLYNLPFEEYKLKQSLGPQMVYSTEEINGWYVVHTWLGDKYIKPNDAVVENYVEKLRLTYYTDLLSEPNSKSMIGARLNPQTVTTIDKMGSYYLINTWLGPRWIEPKYPIVGDIEPFTEKIILTQSKDLYEVPYDTMKTGARLAANQVVTPTEKWGKWVLINTWLGDKWILV